MTRCRQTAGTLVLGVLLAASAWAEQPRIYRDGSSWVQEVAGTLPAGRRLLVKIASGGVRIQGGNAPNISYTVRSRIYVSSEAEARSIFAHFRVAANSRGEESVISGEWMGSRPRKYSGEATLQVPRTLEAVVIESKGGDLAVTDVAGRVEAQSGGGNVHMGVIGGNVNVETGGGNVDVHRAGGVLKVSTGGGNIDLGEVGSSAEIETGGGNVRLMAAGGSVSIKTGGGNIHAKKCNGQMRASTGGGTIEIGDVQGGVEVDTGGGSIRVASSNGPVRAETGAGMLDLGRIVDGIHAQTGGGGITAQLVSGSLRSDSELETPAGDIIVYMAPDVRVTVRAAVEVASGHHISSEFQDIRVISEGGDWGARSFTAEGRVNGGGPLLKVHTTTGNIEFRRVTESARR